MHVANDLICRLGVNAQSLTEIATVTALSNDHGYREVYARQLAAKMQRDDVAIAVSSSGESENIVAAINLVKRAGGTVVTLTGMSPTNQCRALGDLNLYLPFGDYGSLEVGHLALLHAGVDAAVHWSNAS
jgi:D-sedoheptulose 7-phosphate isomerase